MFPNVSWGAPTPPQEMPTSIHGCALTGSKTPKIPTLRPHSEGHAQWLPAQQCNGTKQKVHASTLECSETVLPKEGNMLENLQSRGRPHRLRAPTPWGSQGQGAQKGPGASLGGGAVGFVFLVPSHEKCPTIVQITDMAPACPRAHPARPAGRPCDVFPEAS